MPNWRKGVQGPQRKPKNWGRRKAATTIQRAFRRRFNSRVSRAVLAKDPVQYRLFGTRTFELSQTPAIVESYSNLKCVQDEVNARFYRTSMKIKPYNLNVKARIDVADTTNQVCLALVRHKRSDPITDADLQAGVGGAGPLLTVKDKPFMDCGSLPNTQATSLTGLSAAAAPSLLLNMFNPKVVDVLKTWTFNVQSPPAGGAATLSAWKPYINFDINFKFKDIWKYKEPNAPAVQESPFPYNNKCYHLIGWSDSITATAHPTYTAQNRISFKDLD